MSASHRTWSVGRCGGMRTLAFSVLIGAVLPAAASEFGDRYPAGSIKDSARAEQALRDADAEAARIERDVQARETECYQRFLVNRCREGVRRDQLAAERELRRVRIEARDLQRQAEAKEGAKRRAEAAARADDIPDAAAPGQPRPARAPEPATREPPATRGITPAEAARNRAAYEQRVTEKQKEAAEEAARAPERAENVREYSEKQAEAAERARQQDAEQKKRETRRAERRRQIEAQEAHRAEVRRKADEAAKAAAKQ